MFDGLFAGLAGGGPEEDDETKVQEEEEVDEQHGEEPAAAEDAPLRDGASEFPAGNKAPAAAAAPQSNRTSGGGTGLLDLWGLANAVSSTVKAHANELAKTVAQTDWKAELMAFSKEAAEEAETISNQAAEAVEHLPEAMEHLPEQAERVAAQISHGTPDTITTVGDSIKSLGASLLLGTRQMIEQVREAVDSEIAQAVQDQRRATRATARGAAASSNAAVAAAAASSSSAGAAAAALVPEGATEEGGAARGHRLGAVRTYKRVQMRLEAEVTAMQRDSSTYCDEPKDAEAYARWREGFSLDAAQAQVDAILAQNSFMAELHSRIVPVVVEREDFWLRYFYRLHKLKAQQEQAPTTDPSPVPVDSTPPTESATAAPPQPLPLPPAQPACLEAAGVITTPEEASAKPANSGVPAPPPPASPGVAAAPTAVAPAAVPRVVLALPSGPGSSPASPAHARPHSCSGSSSSRARSPAAAAPVDEPAAAAAALDTASDGSSRGEWCVVGAAREGSSRGATTITIATTTTTTTTTTASSGTVALPVGDDSSGAASSPRGPLLPPGALGSPRGASKGAGLAGAARSLLGARSEAQQERKPEGGAPAMGSPGKRPGTSAATPTPPAAGECGSMAAQDKPAPSGAAARRLRPAGEGETEEAWGDWD